jgi:DNA-binding response OmpR family regulator
MGVAQKILIVDDDEATRRGLQLFFESAKFDVVVAGSFAEARAALSQAMPDLLIADVRLGEFNGLQLVATSPRPIPAIIITGYADHVLEADAHALGAEYVLKPVSLPALLALVQEKLALGVDHAFRTPRRWARKRVPGDLPAQVDSHPARILDVSYGGLRLELAHHGYRSIPSSFVLNVPSSGISVPVDVVWTTRASDDRWVCGASISEGEDATHRAWHGLVDTIAAP